MLGRDECGSAMRNICKAVSASCPFHTTISGVAPSLGDSSVLGVVGMAQLLSS